MASLNADVLEHIFHYLDFRSLCAAEMTCKHWKEVITDRRLYWQLSKRLSSMAVPTIFLEMMAKKKRKRKTKQEFEPDEYHKERRKIRYFTPVKIYGNKKKSL